MDEVVDQLSGVLERVIDRSSPSASALINKIAAEPPGIDPAQLERFYADIWALFCDELGKELATQHAPSEEQ